MFCVALWPSYKNSLDKIYIEIHWPVLSIGIWLHCKLNIYNSFSVCFNSFFFLSFFFSSSFFFFFFFFWGGEPVLVIMLLIWKSSPCNGGSRFPLSLSKWSFTMCLMPNNRKWNVLNAFLNKTFPSFHCKLLVLLLLCFNKKIYYYYFILFVVPSATNISSVSKIGD